LRDEPTPAPSGRVEAERVRASDRLIEVPREHEDQEEGERPSGPATPLVAGEREREP
jgi:hypothetical protein